MAANTPTPAPLYSGLHPLTINGWALLEFDQKMNLQLTELERRFHVARRHAFARLVLPDRGLPPKQPR